jgi:hypothetical protein
MWLGLVLTLPLLLGTAWLADCGDRPQERGSTRDTAVREPIPDEDAPHEDFPTGQPVFVESERTRADVEQRPAIPKAPPLIGGGIWLAHGPGPAINAQVENILPGPDEVSGAIHAVAPHPMNPDVLYVGGANGGVWITSNATASAPFWTPLTDFDTSLSIGALEFDPLDATHQTLVAGMGRYSAFAQRGGVRSGLLRTTDGGTLWTPLDAAMAGRNISGVAPRGLTIVASVNTANSATCGAGGDYGIWRSVNGGVTFGLVGTGSGVPPAAAHDLASDLANPNVLYTGITFGWTCSGGMLSNGIYKSIDTGASWVKVSTPLMDTFIIDFTTNNIEIAAAGNDVFVNIIQIGQPAAIFYSGDGGGTWQQMDLPRTPEVTPAAIASLTAAAPIVIGTGSPHGLSTGMEVEISGVTTPASANGVWTITWVSSTTFSLNGSSGVPPWSADGVWVKVAGLNPRIKPGGQGSIHASIRTHPFFTNQVYIGGDRQDTDNTGSFPNFIGAMDYTGRLFRGDPTVAPTGKVPSPQWEHLTHSNAVGAIPGGGTASSSAPHADSREMKFDASEELIEGDDGGIYRRTLPTSNTGDWFSINGNIQVTEQHDAAYDAVSNVIISGNQDTATTEQSFPGSLVWDTVGSGDGGDVQVDETSMVGNSIRYSSSQFLLSFQRRVYDASNVIKSWSFPALNVLSGQPLITNFVTPVELNAQDPTWLVIGGCNAVYESFDKGDNITQIGGLSSPCSPPPGIFSRLQNAIAYGGKNGLIINKDVLYVGTGTDVWLRTTSGGSLANLPAYPGTANVSDIVLDPSDWRIAFVVDPTKVYVTADAGASWTDITGNLTDTGLQSAAFIPGTPDRVVVGGRDGVFALNLPPAATPVWGELGIGLPNAPVWDLEYDTTDGVLLAATMGRGAWTLQWNGSCGHPDDLVLRNLHVTAARTDTACKTIHVGPNTSSSSTANWLIKAGDSISLGNGVQLDEDVTLEIDGSLSP